MPLKARNDIHLARRLWHFFGVMVIFTIYWAIPPERASLTAVIMCAPVVIADLLRLYFPRLNRTLTWLFKPFMREKERHRLAAVSFMLVGVCLVIWFFPRNVVLLSLLFLAVADPLASIFGIRYGTDKLIGEKSLQGTLAAFAACFVLSLIFYYAMDLMTERLFIVCLLSGLIGAIAELIPVGKLDDNLTIPLLSACFLTGLFSLFGGF